MNLTKSRLSVYLPAAIAVTLTVSMIFFPEEAYSAAVKGVDVWWNIVFPALLPFFIGSEILMGLGVVHFLGVLLEPLMRPVFNVPGTGSFVMAMGLASGFPIGSILSARLRREGLCSKAEGERLMSFTNTADPLYMAGPEAVGMFGRPEIAFIIATAHYLSSIATGFLMRFYGKDRSVIGDTGIQGNIISRGLNALYLARRKDGRPIGQLMGDAIRSAVNSMLLIGGFIILFSVIIRMLTIVGATDFLGNIAFKFLRPLGLDRRLLPALISGFFEIDLGCELAGEAAGVVPLLQAVIVTGAIIGWSGLSVHAQVASIISDTDMKIKPFILARCAHAVLAAFFSWLLMGPLGALTVSVTPVFAPLQPAKGLNFFMKAALMSRLFLIITAALLLLGVVINVIRNLKLVVFRG